MERVMKAGVSGRWRQTDEGGSVCMRVRGWSRCTAARVGSVLGFRYCRSSCGFVFASLFGLALPDGTGAVGEGHGWC
jgi:hypothetical protein